MSEQHFLTPPSRRTKRLPPWFKVVPMRGENYRKIRALSKGLNLHTVCEEARCPNIWECWNAGTATFMILGEICTRSCGFCNVTFGRPGPLDLAEPRHVAEAIARLGLRHAVITSVNRDELEDGGAEIFAETIRQVRTHVPDCTIEVLIPDFQGKPTAIEAVIDSRPDILAHNMETVPSLYRLVRPQAQYLRSLQVLIASIKAGILTKTGMMLGIGETLLEVEAVMKDLVRIGCDILTLGQYLQPTEKHLPVARFLHPSEFTDLKETGERMGLRHVEAGPLVRSSYHAERQASMLPMAL